MTNLSDLFPSLIPRDIYTPVAQDFGDALAGTSHYTDTSVNMTGNKETLVFIFNRAPFTGNRKESVMYTWGVEFRIGVVVYSSDYTAEANRANTLMFSARNSTGTTVMWLFTPTTIVDGNNHTVFFEFDGDAGTAQIIIDGQDADDLTNGDRVGPAVTTLSASSSGDIFVGHGWSIDTQYFKGMLGFFGVMTIGGLSWQDFMDSSGNPIKQDEDTWSNSGWSSQPLIWNEHCRLNANKGSIGNLTPVGTYIPTPEEVVAGWVQQAP